MPKCVLSEISTKRIIYFSVGLKLLTHFTFCIVWNNPQTIPTTTFNSQAAQETKLIKTLSPSQPCFLERGYNLSLRGFPPLASFSWHTRVQTKEGCVPQVTLLSCFWKEWVGSSFFDILLCGALLSPLFALHKSRWGICCRFSSLSKQKGYYVLWSFLQVFLQQWWTLEPLCGSWHLELLTSGITIGITENMWVCVTKAACLEIPLKKKTKQTRTAGSVKSEHENENTSTTTLAWNRWTC